MASTSPPTSCRPVTQITPTASHHGITFERGAAFDLNPVVWKTFVERGIALRGLEAGDLGLDPEPHLLRQWNIDNLNGYWRSCATAAMNGRPPLKPRMPARWATSWTVLGPPRLHHTVATARSSRNSKRVSTPWRCSIRNGIRSSRKRSHTGGATLPIQVSPAREHATPVPGSSRYTRCERCGRGVEVACAA